MRRAVQVLYPNGGEILDGTFTISWNGSDQDGDRLTYQVGWSWDDGSTWEPLSGRIGSTTMEVHYGLAARRIGLPGSGLSVSDGFFTCSRIAQIRHLYGARIHRLWWGSLIRRNGQVFYPGDTIFFSGDGSDPETGSLSGESLTWSVRSR